MQKLFKIAGFTLIELMVAVMIVGILASIAYPAYQEHVFKTRRAAGKACLLEAGQYMERYYTTKMTYAMPPESSLPTCSNDVSSFYILDFGTPGATTYDLTATPTGAQANDKCGTLTLNQAGDTNISSQATGITKTDCW